MSSNVGLSTPRGSGTSGYVQLGPLFVVVGLVCKNLRTLYAFQEFGHGTSPNDKVCQQTRRWELVHYEPVSTGPSHRPSDGFARQVFAGNLLRVSVVRDRHVLGGTRRKQLEHETDGIAFSE